MATMMGPQVLHAQALLRRSDSFGGSNHYNHYATTASEYQALMMEKRQLFLRSYQFSRKRSWGERIKRSLWRVKRVVWSKFRSVRRLRRLVWAKLCRSVTHRHGHGGGCFCFSRRRSSAAFLHLLSSNH